MYCTKTYLSHSGMSYFALRKKIFSVKLCSTQDNHDYCIVLKFALFLCSFNSLQLLCNFKFYIVFSLCTTSTSAKKHLFFFLTSTSTRKPLFLFIRCASSSREKPQNIFKNPSITSSVKPKRSSSRTLENSSSLKLHPFSELHTFLDG